MINFNREYFFTSIFKRNNRTIVTLSYKNGKQSMSFSQDIRHNATELEKKLAIQALYLKMLLIL